MSRSHEHEIIIAAPIERVWAGLTEPALLSRWIVKGAEIEARKGGLLKLDWGEEGLSEARVEIWDPPGRLQYLHLPWEGCPPYPAEGGPRDLYHLEASGEGTRLRLLCFDMPDAPEWDEFVEGTRKGWPFFLGKLKEVLEGNEQG